MTDTEQPEDDSVIYRDIGGEWRWTMRSAGNHEVIAASTEGYGRMRDAAANYERVTGRTAPSKWEESLG